MASSSPEDQAIRKICSKNFHQALWLPRTADHAELRVTYSTTTNFDNNVSLPVVLFIGPMFGTRYFALHLDKLAADCGVRMIIVDRPAFGGSTPVSIDVRMRVWLETIPVLLQRLDVKHVAIVTHLAGTIYTLNTLLHYRSILDPKAPYVAFLAPFVPSAHSGAALPTIASKLPINILNSYTNLNTFVNSKLIPSASWSSGIISSATALFTSPTSTDLPSAEISTSSTLSSRYGSDEETAKLIEKLSSKFQFAENTTGVNEELKLVLRRCDDADWGGAIEYPSCVRKIADNETEFVIREPNAAR
ncbi:hypothetical protein BDV97DRAFT_395740 [Delphinella strobiligena]|nr:hypothetical protein BDV97DRAFT_395740 [Delphinella strobiligena]